MSDLSIQKALEIAMEEHRAGHFQRAQELYVSILQSDPGNVDAMHLLGVLAHQGKRSDMGAEMIEKAISVRPDEPVFRFNVADCYIKLGEWEKAAAHLKEATKLNNDYFEAWNNLGHVYMRLRRYEEALLAASEAYELADNPAIPLNTMGLAQRGLMRLDESTASFKEALEEDPDFVEAANNLAMNLASKRAFSDAEAMLRESLAKSPLFADTYNNIGLICLWTSRLEEAAEFFQNAIRLDATRAEFVNNLAIVIFETGRIEEALVTAEQALTLAPEHPEVLNTLAGIYREVGRMDDSLKASDQALSIVPNAFSYYYNKSTTLHLLNRIDEALENLEKAIQLAPDDGGLHISMGYKLIERGDVVAGLEHLQQGLREVSAPEAYSSVLLGVNYLESYAPEEITKLHQEWGAMLAKSVPADDFAFGVRTDRKKLRVGYLSPDIRTHSVYFFAEPIFEHHNKDEFEVYCYSGAKRPDSKTLHAKVQSDVFRETSGLTDQELLDLIRRDEVDILVDLAGHTSGNRLQALVKRAAPIQVSGIGYPCTTGLPTMDYRFTDSWCDPAGTEHLSTEELVRLDPCFWVYCPPAGYDEIAPTPAVKNGFLTFATINNFAKVQPGVQDLWAEILNAIPNSRLIMLSAGTGSKVAVQGVRERFESHGIAADRLDLRGSVAFDKFMGFFAETDVVLDPFPFNGGTTTCHNLWMGCPTLTLAGGMHAGRMGVSMMNNVGLPEFIAQSKAEYVEIAKRLAGDIPFLQSVRASLRERMVASPLRDEIGYVRRLEAAYWSMARAKGLR